LSLKNNELTLLKEIAGKGIPQHFELENIAELRKYEEQKPSFIGTMTNSYWIINQYTLTFNYLGKPIYFALELSDKEASHLLKILKKKLA